MADKIFHTGFLEKVAPVGADKVMISDSEAMNQTKFTDIANLPISTATSTAIGVVQSDIDIHEARTDNPHSVTKAQVGLSNVDNTSDSTKNSATATLTNKTLTSPVINTPTGIVKADVGLGNVDNTTDANKPISTATQTALNAKQDTITGLTASGAELNILDGATLSTTELNYVDGVTSAIQTQLDTKSSLTQIQNNTKQDLALAITPNYDAISGAIVLDSSKNHYHGTVSGATYVPNGGLNGGGAYDFDGVDDYIELNDGMVIKSFSVALQDSSPSGLYIRDNNIDVYIIGTVTDTVYRYQMSIPGDISTCTFHSSYSISGLETIPNAISFSIDGTKMYILGNTGDDITYFTLSVAWDITTSTRVGEFSVSSQDISPVSIYMRADGLKFYISGTTSDTIYQYSMSSAWDMSTASYDSISLSVAAQEVSVGGLEFTPDGTKMFISGQSGDDVTEYALSTAWNVSTATITGIAFYIGTQDINSFGIRFNSTGTSLYVIGDANNTIYQYNLYSAYSFSNPMYSNGFTIIGWIKPDSDGEAALGTIIGKNAGTLAQSGYYYSVNANTLRMRIADGAGTGTNRASGASSITYGNWHYVAVTVDNTGLVTHYINAVQSGTPGISSAPSNITTTNATRIGNRSTATDRTYDGQIGALRIISRVLTATEIANDYLQRVEIDNPPEVPRLTTAMRDVMSPSLGQQVYNTTTNKAQVYNEAWNDLY